MQVLTRNYSVSSRLIFIFRVFGVTFLSFKRLCDVLKKFVFNSQDQSASAERLTYEDERSNAEFIANCESLTAIFPEITAKDHKTLFKELHEFGIKCNIPTGCLLISTREKCRSCGKVLSLEKKPHTVMVYDLKNGPLVGSRMTKICRKCKIYEHHGYWTMEGKKHYDMESLNGQYLLTSEETAMDIDLLKDMTNLFIVGAVPFSTYATSYNRRFGSGNDGKTDCDDEKNARKQRDISETFERRRCLDRRRLEEGVILYASLEVMGRHKFGIKYFPYDKNELAKSVVLHLHTSFLAKWAEHCCDHEGCRNVVVIDGNMKNARQVCSCKNVTQLEFEEMYGGITVGCLNTPSKGSRLCAQHLDTSTTFRDDENLMNNDRTLVPVDGDKRAETVDDVLPLTVCNEKVTRNGKFLEIKWSNGQTTWVRESNLPSTFLEEKKGIQVMEIKEIGQKRKEYVHVILPENGQRKGNKCTDTFESHGFAVEKDEDNSVLDDNSTKARVLICGTEKGKHKCKNAKTAGILVFERPCGVVIDVRELYGSESKSQVYAHLHTLMNQKNMENTDVICYDDACHLKKFAQNSVRAEKTNTSKRLAVLEIVCDRFHFGNHTDKWCKKNCNPYDSKVLKNVNTEVCEQLFSWLSLFGKITRHMNRWRFLFFMLYVLDCHNEDVVSKKEIAMT